MVRAVEGDLGARVSDWNGLVAGMITSGDVVVDGKGGYSGGVVTYASTMEWILEDVKRFGYNLELV